MGLETIVKRLGKKAKDWSSDLGICVADGAKGALTVLGANILYGYAADTALEYLSNLDKVSDFASGAIFVGSVGLGVFMNIGPKIKGKYHGLVPVMWRWVKRKQEKDNSLIRAAKADDEARQLQAPMRRRKFIEMLVGGAAVAGGYLLLKPAERFNKWTGLFEAPEEPKTALSAIGGEQPSAEMPHKAEALPTPGAVFPIPRYLQWKELNDLYQLYLGTIGLVGTELPFRPQQLLKTVWDSKLAFMAGKGIKNGVVNAAMKNALEEYNPKTATKMTVDDLVREASDSVKSVNKSLDWKEITKMYGLSDDETSVLKKLAGSINGQDLITYGLTELMPAVDGKKNRMVLETLLRNFGKEYLMFIPAMFDGKVSFGLYQWTEYAVYSAGGERRGASRVNQALPEDKRIPDSVIMLRGDDNHKAAYMFAINNLAVLMQRLSGKRLGKLEANWNKEFLQQFIATAHHSPESAIRSVKAWLDQKGEKLKKPFSAYLSDDLFDYAEKTKANIGALTNDLGYETEKTSMPASIAKVFPNGIPFEIAGLPGFDFVKVNGDCNFIFRYRVEKGDYRVKIAQIFNNSAQGKYKPLDYDRVRDSQGGPIGKLKAGHFVYVWADKAVAAQPASTTDRLSEVKK